MKKRKSSTVTNVTKSEARRQENLRRRRERDRQWRAEEIAEQREERLAIDAEREIEQVGNYVLPRRDTHGRIRTELITNIHARESLILCCVGNQLCPDPGVRVSPRESLMLSCVDDQLCPDPGVRVSPR